MRCTIFENKLIWLRKNSTTGNINNFNILKLFIFRSFGKHHRQLTLRFWKWQVYVATNPFEPITTISIGDRFFDYHFVQLKYEKSKASI
jgi:hypothetical protein